MPHEMRGSTCKGSGLMAVTEMQTREEDCAYLSAILFTVVPAEKTMNCMPIVPRCSCCSRNRQSSQRFVQQETEWYQLYTSCVDMMSYTCYQTACLWSGSGGPMSLIIHMVDRRCGESGYYPDMYDPNCSVSGPCLHTTRRGAGWEGTLAVLVCTVAESLWGSRDLSSSFFWPESLTRA